MVFTLVLGFMELEKPSREASLLNPVDVQVVRSDELEAMQMKLAG